MARQTALVKRQDRCARMLIERRRAAEAQRHACTRLRGIGTDGCRRGHRPNRSVQRTWKFLPWRRNGDGLVQLGIRLRLHVSTAVSAEFDTRTDDSTASPLEA